MRPEQRWLIARGWEGFADRLQSLSWAISTARQYNRVLYVDWRDRIWGTDFYRYFTFYDLPHETKLQRIPQHAATYPRWWQHRLCLPADNWIYDVRSELEWRPEHTQDASRVWVQPGTGYRAYNWPQMLQHLRIRPDVRPLIQSVYDSDLPLVHLRGTDRTFTEADWQRVRTAAPRAQVVGDDPVLIQRWLHESPESMIISRPRPGITHFSTHAGKHASNIALLREFFMIAQAPVAHALNENSLFFQCARQIGACDDYGLLWQA